MSRSDNMWWMSEEAQVIRVVNRQARRMVIALIVLAGVWTAVVVPISIREGLPLPLVNLVPLLSFPSGLLLGLLVVPRLAGVVHVQPWLDVSGDGLDYGGRQFVPWANVVAVRLE